MLLFSFSLLHSPFLLVYANCPHALQVQCPNMLLRLELEATKEHSMKELVAGKGNKQRRMGWRRENGTSVLESFGCRKTKHVLNQPDSNNSSSACVFVIRSSSNIGYDSTLISTFPTPRCGVSRTALLLSYCCRFTSPSANKADNTAGIERGANRAGRRRSSWPWSGKSLPVCPGCNWFS